MKALRRLSVAVLAALVIAYVWPVSAQVLPGSPFQGGSGGGGGIAAGDNVTWTGTHVFSNVTPIKPQGGIDLNVNSATAGYLTNAFGAAKILLANTGDVRIDSASSAQRIYLRNSARALTAGVATSFLEIAVPAGTVTGGTIQYTILANDATDFQARSGVLVYAAANPSGTEVCTLGRPDGGSTVDNTTDIVAVSSGTLTNTFTCVTGLTSAVQIAANAASSLTETTLNITYSVFKNGGTGGISPQ